MHKAVKYTMVVAIIGLTFAYYQTQKLLLLTDLSTQPIRAQDNPDFIPDSQEPYRAPRMPVYLISYAAGGEVYFQNQQALAQSAQGRGVDFVLNYRRSLLDPKFLKTHQEILDTKMGAGLWIWKPWIIQQTLASAPENAVIIYMDGGFIIRGSLRPLIEKVQGKPVLMAQYTNGSLAVQNVSQYQARFLKAHFQVLKRTPLKPAGFLVIRNCPESRAFIAEWLGYCVRKDMINYTPAQEPEDPAFQSTQYDQSLINLTALNHPHTVQTISYEDELVEKYVYWVHRRPPACDPRTSLVPYYGYTPMCKIEKAFYNLRPLMWLREKILKQK
jgi:hypothetical protein